MSNSLRSSLLLPLSLLRSWLTAFELWQWPSSHSSYPQRSAHSDRPPEPQPCLSPRWWSTRERGEPFHLSSRRTAIQFRHGSGAPKSSQKSPIQLSGNSILPMMCESERESVCVCQECFGSWAVWMNEMGCISWKQEMRMRSSTIYIQYCGCYIVVVQVM